jgi:hypothetical protein
MNAFILQLENRPGTLAEVAAVLARADVNIASGAGMLVGLNAGFGFVPDDDARAMEALDAAGVGYRVREVVQAPVADSPGGLADVTRRLADAGVNIELLLPISTSDGSLSIAFAVNDPETARSTLARAHLSATR